MKKFVGYSVPENELDEDNADDFDEIDDTIPED